MVETTLVLVLQGGGRRVYSNGGLGGIGGQTGVKPRIIIKGCVGFICWAGDWAKGCGLGSLGLGLVCGCIK